MTYFDIDALRHGFSSRDFLDESWSHGLGEVHLVIGDIELYLGVALGAHPLRFPATAMCPLLVYPEVTVA